MSKKDKLETKRIVAFKIFDDIKREKACEFATTCQEDLINISNRMYSIVVYYWKYIAL